LNMEYRAAEGWQGQLRKSYFCRFFFALQGEKEPAKDP